MGTTVAVVRGRLASAGSPFSSGPSHGVFYPWTPRGRDGARLRQLVLVARMRWRRTGCGRSSFAEDVAHVPVDRLLAEEQLLRRSPGWSARSRAVAAPELARREPERRVRAIRASPYLSSREIRRGAQLRETPCTPRRARAPRRRGRRPPAARAPISTWIRAARYGAPMRCHASNARRSGSTACARVTRGELTAPTACAAIASSTGLPCLRAMRSRSWAGVLGARSRPRRRSGSRRPPGGSACAQTARSSPSPPGGWRPRASSGRPCASRSNASPGAAPARARSPRGTSARPPRIRRAASGSRPAGSGPRPPAAGPVRARTARLAICASSIASGQAPRSCMISTGARDSAR